MTDPCRPFRQMARNALLANRRLHGACDALAPGEWEAPRASFFPSIRATMNHILVIDRFYLDAIGGGTLGPAAWDDPEPCADLAAWAEAQVEMDLRAVAIAEALVPGDLNTIVQIQRAGRVQIETLGDTLLHLFLHDQHHRGQIHAMLSSTSVAPPQLDEFVMVDDAAVRGFDLSAFGRTEEWIRA
ncbi:DinB family protein [Frigidibacter sp. MR17.24]|uniref:DinB family protein n=1 Tax=Frigidibacter sp. MR17.24 TaxID=3127345 RepID=UPI0030130203